MVKFDLLTEAMFSDSKYGNCNGTNLVLLFHFRPLLYEMLYTHKINHCYYFSYQAKLTRELTYINTFYI